MQALEPLPTGLLNSAVDLKWPLTYSLGFGSLPPLPVFAKVASKLRCLHFGIIIFKASPSEPQLPLASAEFVTQQNRRQKSNLKVAASSFTFSHL